MYIKKINIQIVKSRETWGVQNQFLFSISFSRKLLSESIYIKSQSGYKGIFNIDFYASKI